VTWGKDGFSRRS